MLKTLKLYNKTNHPVEFGLTSNPNVQPLTTVVIPPGEMDAHYAQPNKDYIWWRYHGDRTWGVPFPILDHPDSVYWWKFTPGPRPNLVGAPEEYGH